MLTKFLTLFFMAMAIPTSQAKQVIRAAIDVGSGGPKLRVAEVDLSNGKITKILASKTIPVNFQNTLSTNGNRTLSPEIMKEGIAAIQEAVFIAKSFNAEGIALIGASPFRNALNGEEFANAIESESGLKFHIMDQDLEGKLAYQATLAKVAIQEEDLVVWDIGGGSVQFAGITSDGAHHIHGRNEGAGYFRDFIIESLQNRKIEESGTPNPISEEHALLAIFHANHLSMLVSPVFREKIQQPKTKIVGAGSVFSNGIARLMDRNPFTVEHLETVVASHVGKTDEDFGGIYASSELSNALLVLGFMKGLGIREMETIDVNNADGAIVYPPFWQ